MKTVKDKDGNTIEVPDNTPCHAGEDGALPIMLDATLDAQVFAEIAERKAKHLADAPKRAKQNIKNKINDLEAQTTPRRLREAVLGNVEWLANQEALIVTERAKL